MKLRRIDWRIESDRVTMVWVDDGLGLPAEVADRLFDPYFSTKSKGTGLGLAICRNLLDKMGGTISLANRSDRAGAVATLVPELARSGGPGLPAAPVLATDLVPRSRPLVRLGLGGRLYFIRFKYFKGLFFKRAL